MKLITTLALLTCLLFSRPALTQLDPDPDGIGVYFDPAATQISAAVPVGDSVAAFLVATLPSGTGTLALWEASVYPENTGLYSAVITGSAVGGFNMATNMPGNPGYSFAVAMETPLPALESLMVLADLQIMVLEEGPIPILIADTTYGPPYYVMDDMFTGPVTLLHPSSGDPDRPVAMVNGPDPVVGSEATWGGLKALFR